MDGGIMTSRLLVDKIEGKADSGTIAMPSGSVVQVAQRQAANSFFSTTNNYSFTDVTNFYVDIAPKFSDSIIIFEAQVVGNVNSSSTHADFRVVNSNNSGGNTFTINWGANTIKTITATEIKA